MKNILDNMPDFTGIKVTPEGITFGKHCFLSHEAIRSGVAPIAARNYTEWVEDHFKFPDKKVEKLQEALEIAVKALENIKHIEYNAEYKASNQILAYLTDIREECEKLGEIEKILKG